MPSYKKNRKQSRNYHKNGKIKYNRKKQDNIAEAQKLDDEDILNKYDKVSTCELHYLIRKLHTYELDVFNIIMNFINNPIVKNHYSIECVKYLRNIMGTIFEDKKNLARILVCNFIDFDLDCFNNHYAFYLIKIITNISVGTSTTTYNHVIFNNDTVYFGSDGHMLEYYEYNDFDIEDPSFGVLTAQQICKLYDHDYIIYLTHLYVYYNLKLSQLTSYICNYNNRSISRYDDSKYNLPKNTNIPKNAIFGSKLRQIYKSLYNIDINIKSIPNDYNYNVADEKYYYELTLYGKDISCYHQITDINCILFSYGSNGFTGLNINTTIDDIKIKCHKIKSTSIKS